MTRYIKSHGVSTSCSALMLVVAAAMLGPLSAQMPPAMAPGSAAAMTDSSEQIADRIVKSTKPVLVDFWAAWCGPCKLLNPIIKELETEYKGRVLFLKVDVDRTPALSRYFQVSAIPAVFIIKDKAVVNMLPGLRPKEAYREALNSVLASAAVKKDTAATKVAPAK
jgi:thioredoxin